MSSEGSTANRGASHRNITDDDLDLYETINDPAMMEHLGGPLPGYGREARTRRRGTDEDRYWVLVIVSSDEAGVAMGTVSIWDHD